MMAEETTLSEVAEIALKEAKRHDCEDVSAICSMSNDSQVRFANNSITLVNSVRNLTLDLYLSKEKKRIVGQSYNPTEEGLKRFIDNLVRSCQALPPSADYVPLPRGPFSYRSHANYDPRVADAPLVEYVKQAIDEAIRAGGLRVSGSLNTEVTDLYIVTSAGASGLDRQSQMLLNVRAFAEDANASGHGLSCSSYLSEFSPAEAGERAGDYAKRSLNSRSIEEAKYDIIFTPTVIANILPIAGAASAFSIESGNSFLTDKLGQKIGVEALNLEDWGVYQNGLGGRVFDDEGMPTGRNEIVSRGTFATILHNTTTAKKFGAEKSTGNAGIIAPRATTVVFGEGDSNSDEMIRETKKGLLVTNNWYTRFQNMRSGDYSTVPRDAAFLVENGGIKEPVSGFRLSDSIPRQLSGIDLVSKTREWIRWWEVSTPTLAPWMKITGVQVTRAVGS